MNGLELKRQKNFGGENGTFQTKKCSLPFAMAIDEADDDDEDSDVVGANIVGTASAVNFDLFGRAKHSLAKWLIHTRPRKVLFMSIPRATFHF